MAINKLCIRVVCMGRRGETGKNIYMIILILYILYIYRIYINIYIVLCAWDWVLYFLISTSGFGFYFFFI